MVGGLVLGLPDQRPDRVLITRQQDWRSLQRPLRLGEALGGGRRAEDGRQDQGDYQDKSYRSGLERHEFTLVRLVLGVAFAWRDPPIVLFIG